MERLVEFEAKQIPKTIFFIWMGRKKFPKGDENPDAAPPQDGRFRRGTVKFSVEHNKDCEATMWLDILSMVDDHIIETAIADQRLKNKYFRWSRIARTPGTPNHLPPQPNFFPDDSVDLRDPQNFQVIVDMLREVRRQFAHWITKSSHWALLIRHTRRVEDMITWCRATGLRVRFLDTDAYLKWMDTDPRSPEYSLVNWVFFELYFRGSNFGAAGDMLRALILYERGGMYCDHDDKLNWMNNKVTLKLTHKTSKYLGFKHCLVLRRYETYTGQTRKYLRRQNFFCFFLLLLFFSSLNLSLLKSLPRFLRYNLKNADF